MPRQVLVPVDGSSQSTSAVRYAAAEWPDATITLLHVIDPATSGGRYGVTPRGSEAWYRNAKQNAEDVFDDIRAAVDADFETRIEVGRPPRTIVEVADEGPYDHLVLGSHGRTGVTRILLGSTAESVVRNSPVPVTVVRGLTAEERAER